MQINTKSYKLKDINSKLADTIASKYEIDGDVELIRKGIPLETKSSVEEDSGTGLMYISTKHTDRDSDIVVPSGAILDEYRLTPVVLWCHKYSMDDVPVGKNLWIKQDKEGLIAKTKFHTRPNTIGEKVYNYLKDGFPLACSIGFVPLKYVDKEDFDTLDVESLGIDKEDLSRANRVFTKWVLLEYSMVPVASNAQSTVIDIKDSLLAVDDEYIYVDYELVKGEKDGNEEQTKSEEQAKSEEGEGSTIGDGEKGEIEFYIDLPEEKTEEEDKFCECEEPEFDDDECKGCGGRRKPRKPKKEFIEEIDDIGFGEVMTDEPNPLEIKDIEELIPFPEIHKLFESLYQKTISDTAREKSCQRQSFTKLLDINSLPSRPGSYRLKVYCEFLGCKIKNVYQSNFVIPWALAASYLMGYKTCVKDFEYLDTRSFGYGENEYPPSYELMKVNSKIEEDFLISGVDFYKIDESGLIAEFSPGWSGVTVSIYTSRRNTNINRKLISDIHKWVETENPMKGEKFSLNGEFIEVDDADTWDTIILDGPLEKSVKQAEKLINTKKKDFSGRGMLFIGPPGTGKTKTGRILMTQTDHTFIWASSKDFARSYYTAEVLSLAFKMARQLSPSILFLEDIDSWISERSGVIDLMKTELDGIKKNRGVITILTTNNPEKLPDALLDRPGRFHDVLNFDLPTEEVRQRMIEFWIGDISMKKLEDIIKSTEGFSGAHMWELIEFAKTIAEDEEISIYDALMMSLEKLQSQRALIQQIREGKKSLGTMTVDIEVNMDEAKTKIQELADAIQKIEPEIEEKSGRTLSRKTRDTIQRAIDALNELLKGTDSKPDDEEDEDEDEDEKKTLLLEEIELAENDKIDSVVKEVLSDIFTTYDIDVKGFVDEAMKKMKGKMF